MRVGATQLVLMFQVPLYEQGAEKIDSEALLGMSENPGPEFQSGGMDSERTIMEMQKENARMRRQLQVDAGCMAELAQKNMKLTKQLAERTRETRLAKKECRSLLQLVVQTLSLKGHPTTYRKGLPPMDADCGTCTNNSAPEGCEQDIDFAKQTPLDLIDGSTNTSYWQSPRQSRYLLPAKDGHEGVKGTTVLADEGAMPESLDRPSKYLLSAVGQPKGERIMVVESMSAVIDEQFRQTEVAMLSRELNSSQSTATASTPECLVS